VSSRAAAPWPDARSSTSKDTPSTSDHASTPPTGPAAEDGVLHIRAEAPGIDPGRDAEVTVDDGMLRVRVERRKEERTETEGRVRSEFRYGSFAPAVSLPKGADASKVSATYRDGVLDVSVPIPETVNATAQKATIDRG
jgi:HSP20 family protein